MIEDITCNLDYMLQVMPLIGVATREKMPWMRGALMISHDKWLQNHGHLMANHINSSQNPMHAGRLHTRVHVDCKRKDKETLSLLKEERWEAFVEMMRIQSTSIEPLFPPLSPFF